MFLYLLLGFAFALLTPPWEAPDEPAHYIYVQQLATRWRPPPKSPIVQRTSFSQDYAYISSNYEWYQPALGYLHLALFYRLLQAFAPASLPQEIPHQNPLFPEDPRINANLFLHSNLKVVQVWSGQWGLLALRLLNSAMGLVVIWAAYRAARYLEGGQGGRFGLFAAGWIAFLPQFLFVNASVRSDTIANALGALVFLRGTGMACGRDGHIRNSLSMGVLLGLGLLSKHTFLIIVPGALILVLLSPARSARARLINLALASLPAFLIWGLYHLAFSEAQVSLAHTTSQAFAIRPDYLSWRYLMSIPQPLLVGIFFGRFGWANVFTPPLWSKTAFGFWALGTLLTGAAMWVHRHDPADRPALNTLLGLAAAWAFAILGVVRYNMAVYQPQGRLLFPALVPWALIGFWGIQRSLKPKWWGLVGTSAVLFMLAFSAASLITALIPAYYR